MGPELSIVELSALAGAATPAVIRFTAGTPVPPLSVGTRGQWIVVAERVGDVHLFLAFDGQNVHVAAAAPDRPVLLAGATVGRQWSVAVLPCELRFGGACLILARKGDPAQIASTGQFTVSDGGALWRAAHRAVQAAKDPSHPPPPAPPLPPPQQTGFADTQMIHPPGANARSTAPPDPSTGASSMGPPSTARIPGAPGLPMNPGTEGAAVADTEGKKSAWRQASAAWQEASAVKKITWVLMPFALFFGYFMLQDDARPPPKMVGGPSSPSHSARVERPQASASSSLPAPSPATGAMTAGAVGAGPLASGSGASNEISGGPPVSGSASAAHLPAAPPATSAGNGRGGVPKGRKTPEREALDAVAAGSFEDAVNDYDTLAAVHPENPSFKDAARILRAKTGHIP